MAKSLKKLARKFLLVTLLGLTIVTTASLAFGADISQTPIKVYLAGDSTVKTYGPSRTTGGWGEYLQNYFQATQVEIINKSDGGTLQPHHGENNAYVMAVVQLAEAMKVDYIDMFAKTKAMYEEVGERAAEKLHDIKADGSVDKTHYNKYGAFVISGMVAAAIKEKGFGFAKDIIASTVKITPTENLKKATLYLVGDSTVCNYGEDPNYAVPRGGWGMFIGD